VACDARNAQVRGVSAPVRLYHGARVTAHVDLPGGSAPPAIRRKASGDRPLRSIVAVQQGGDGLIYEVLDCDHVQVITAQVIMFGQVLSRSRRCNVCPRQAQTTATA
jgi:hypothetical protein